MLQSEIEAGVSRAERGSKCLDQASRSEGGFFANQAPSPTSLVHAMRLGIALVI